MVKEWQVEAGMARQECGMRTHSHHHGTILGIPSGHGNIHTVIVISIQDAGVG